jgi:hypothetical protein
LIGALVRLMAHFDMSTSGLAIRAHSLNELDPTLESGIIVMDHIVPSEP